MRFFPTTILILLFSLDLFQGQFYQPTAEDYYGPTPYQFQPYYQNQNANPLQQWIEQRRRDRARDIGPKDGSWVGGPGGWGGGSGARGGAWTGGH
ncbi:hypothetical protein L596_011461 [Steinernema carpocapsae]|uniref:Secreted protein n=1 Tax=Steinernema carpocapsae TaxID=34508 RepID=A0A4U5NUF5_STECR|nr:hypothetical protein L596_011461 [Steinernema carpocapsae]